MSIRALVLLAGTTLVVGCGPQEFDQVDLTTEPIIGGSTDNSDPSVVAIFAHAPGATSGSLCTGTVISAHAVLTAAHCVDPAVVGSGMQFDVIPGTTLSLANALKVSSTAYDTAFNVNNLSAGHDVGIVRLTNATTLAPVKFNTTALGSSTLSTPVRLIGYGSNTHTNSGAGTKRTVTTTVDDYSSLLVHIGTSSKQTCHGDSGGPAIQKINGVDTIIGVTSFGSDASANNVCNGGGYDTRIDRYASFINSHL